MGPVLVGLTLLGVVLPPMSGPVDDIETRLRAAEERIFAAIQARDLAALEVELAEDFVHSSPGSPDQERSAFLEAVRDMPYRVLEIRGDEVRVRVLDQVALVSGIQRARVAVSADEVVLASTAFVDVFVRTDGAWRLRHAWSVELPSEETP